ncbi:flap structure-specific endonuclease [Rhizoctonia solani 123E]|uniref:Flap structure-specific endonuclease n=1 Tax=Rhizoctonia solani 123E TaxID=1423351 RepID=A0A074S2Z2_9AGAM|nr:flap structure-specific endonuclease [Rhizoctonia solani 123E]
MGVKQLWTLLSPVGRPVPLETLEGKVLAIDSSIWLYQFQATMRDKEGRALVNAHILGFIRRISKLLFYGIKPVFVFDGGAPVLKRSTIAERKKRKSGAAASHAKVAEKLLAAQLRREALRHTEEQGREKASDSTHSKRRSGVDDDANYLEDLSGPSLVLPGKHNAPPPKPASKSSSPSKPKPSSKPAAKTFREHDPYRLPELDTSIDARALPNDPRLATDEEVRAYISHLRPDDPEFHELPADAQYEILGELRLKSRTTSHKRLQKMLKQSSSPMDFSMAQIKNLGQRNRLTQEVLSTLNMVGTGGGVVVPVKIANEKNREYVLVRNEQGDRGFTLGIRQEGNTAEKPIVVEEEDGEGDDSFDSKTGDVWEDVVVPGRSQIGVTPDPDWRDFKRQNALDGLAKRDTRKRLVPLTTKSKPVRVPRLDKGKGKEAEIPSESEGSHSSEEEDMDFQLAVQASLSGDQVQGDEEDDLHRAISLSLAERNMGSSGAASMSANPESASMGLVSSSGLAIAPDSELFGAPNGLLGLGGDVSMASSPPQVVDHEADFEDDDLDMEEVIITAPSTDEQRLVDSVWEGVEDTDTVTSDPVALEPILSQPHTNKSPLGGPVTHEFESAQLEPTSRRTSATRRELAQALASSGDEDEGDEAPLPSRLMTILAPYQTPSGSGATGSPRKKSEGTPKSGAQPQSANNASESPTKKPSAVESARAKRVTWNEPPKTETPSNTKPDLSQHSRHESKDTSDTIATQRESIDAPESFEEDLDEVVAQDLTEKLRYIPSTSQTGDETAAKTPSMPSWFSSAPTVGVSAPSKQQVLAELSQDTKPTPSEETTEYKVGNESWESIPVQLSDDEEEMIPWSRSPTPTGARSPVAVPVYTEPDFDSARSRTSRLQDENEEHASFISQLQGKSYTTTREALDAEIASLRKERAAALRDAEDVTAQMSAQIQVLLRLFGVPFVNAPMEAEAQCAFLAQRGLVEGVITDDSDVFLFGAGRVYRNMFNQSKVVECFLSADLERELGLDRETLISLAYLLGSDYTEGLSGVGPVVAMEIMKEFPGDTGLTEFRTWWRKIQVGKDTQADLSTTFRKRFKKKFTSLHLTDEWPNPKVREAYLEPTVDPSEERFEWGLPDLDGLRRFLGDELSWATEKVDETILPVIRRMTQRSSSSATNRQGTLTSFFDGPAATSNNNNATRAPRKSQAYASKRLQQVVAAYRARKSGEGDTNEDNQAEVGSENERTKAKSKGATKPQGNKRRKPTQQMNDAPADQEAESSAAGPKGAKRKRAPNKAESARGSKRGRGTARGRGRGRGKGVRSTTNREDEEEIASDAGSQSSKGEAKPEAPSPKKPRLRPRMKQPSPAPRSPAPSESEGGSSDEYVES